jgi:hypothetical protein
VIKANNNEEYHYNEETNKFSNLNLVSNLDITPPPDTEPFKLRKQYIDKTRNKVYFFNKNKKLTLGASE